MRSSPATADVRPATRVDADLDAIVACPRCRAAAAWGALVQIAVLEGAALESHLSVPPNGWFVDVRACSGCGGSLARKVRTRRARAGQG